MQISSFAYSSIFIKIYFWWIVGNQTYLNLYTFLYTELIKKRIDGNLLCFFFALEEKITKMKTFDFFCLFINTTFAANWNDLPGMRNILG